MKNWTITDSEKLYGIKRWGMNYFTISEKGTVLAHPFGDEKNIDLLEVIKEAKSLGHKPPMTIRIQDLLHCRVRKLNNAFSKAIREENYKGKYRGVFPIKTNHLREVVEEILKEGEKYHYGIEAGSKGELMIAVAFPSSENSLIVCNGYKDDDYIRTVLDATRMGKKTIIVVEQLSDIDDIIRLSRQEEVIPLIGIRVKLGITGEGKWAASVGENAKFGLFPSEIMTALQKLKRAKLHKSLRLIHFHIGSQVPNIATIKAAANEASRYYCELRRMGFDIEYIDCGGGMAIDYDGSRSNYESSSNYSLEEYARSLVYTIKDVCDSAGMPHPNIVTESGRAVVSPHSILVLEVFDTVGREFNEKLFSVKKNAHSSLKNLAHILEEKSTYKSNLERFLDAKQLKQEIHSLFLHGILTLEDRAQAENIFWGICADIKSDMKNMTHVPEDLDEVFDILAPQYICNFSVFQSLLDHWALKQLFPILPLQRLDEEPTIEATLADITCDSDGKIAKFIDLEQDELSTLALHKIKKNEPYYIGVFLVGAYQDIMGDQHNLFGRVDEVHVFLEDDEEDGFYVEDTISGNTIEEVLPQIQYKPEYLVQMLKKEVDRAIKADIIKPREGVKIISRYNKLLKTRTYLD